MRVIAGQYGGKRLQAPKGRDVRPTSDKIRGAIFNALQSRISIEDVAVLDGFCGTGALGLEALSRGAARCIFIDNSAVSIATAKENIRALSVQDVAQIMKYDVVKLPMRPDTFPTVDVVFLDPPYAQGLLSGALKALERGDWMSDQAILVLESEKSWFCPIMANYNLQNEKIYGDTKVSFLEYCRTT